MSHDHSEVAHHSLGYGAYFLVWLALVAGTGLTVGVAFFDFGVLTIPVALSIAFVKTLLVVTYFMHVKFESRAILYMILVCFVMLVIFLGLPFVDFYYRY